MEEDAGVMTGSPVTETTVGDDSRQSRVYQ